MEYQVKRVFFISIAVVSSACGGSSRSGDSAAPGGQVAATARAGTDTALDKAGRDQTVTLVGCLQGPRTAEGTAGTSGTNARAAAPIGGEAGASSSARYTLADAMPPTTDTTGTGASGAGASGGPLVSGRSSYDLDGVAAEGASNVNKQVRVTGRVDANPVSTGGSPSASDGAPRASGTTTGAGSSTGIPTTSANRRLIVDSMQVVSDRCPQR
jgi:hypothetical protein